MTGGWARRLSLILAGVLTTAIIVRAPPVLGLAECTVPAELIDVDAKLPQLAEKLRSGGPVRIVALGGASTLGSAAGSPDLAYPRRLQEALLRWYPAIPISVVNKGVPRQTAQQMLARFPSDVFAEDPVLVIWETGTTDAVRGVDVE